MQTLNGNYPILATAWTEDGRFDRASQARLIDWLIDSGVHGLVMLANASEAHAQSDAEKDEVLEYGVKRVAGRVPVVATVTHFSAEVASERARKAEDLGVACIMSMPQFFGTWNSDFVAARSYYETLARAVSIPVMVQDHPVSGVQMRADFLARLAGEIDNVSYFKLEFTQSPYKAHQILEKGEDAVAEIFGGESGVYFLEEYERGVRGTMPGCYMPRIFTRTFELLEAGDLEGAHKFFAPYIPLLNFELRMANRNLWKCVLKELGVIASDRIRGPLPAYWDETTKRQFLDHVYRVDPKTFGVSLKSRPIPAQKSERVGPSSAEASVKRTSLTLENPS